MKIKIFFLIFSLIVNSACAQWTQTNGPEGCYPTCFARISSGILCGSVYGMYFSSEEGQTWQDFVHFSIYNIHSILTRSDTIFVIFNQLRPHFMYCNILISFKHKILKMLQEKLKFNTCIIR